MKIKNPQMYQQINQLRQSNGNPSELLKQVIGNYTPEQMNNFINQARMMGFNDSLLNQISGINTQ